MPRTEHILGAHRYFLIDDSSARKAGVITVGECLPTCRHFTGLEASLRAFARAVLSVRNALPPDTTSYPEPGRRAARPEPHTARPPAALFSQGLGRLYISSLSGFSSVPHPTDTRSRRAATGFPQSAYR